MRGTGGGRRTGGVVVLVAALLVLGCGGEGGEDGSDPGVVEASRDPTLRGLARRLEELGLEVSKKRALPVENSQKAAIGRAAGLANELAGASIRSDLPTETELRRIEGVDVLLERFASPEKARAVHAERQAVEDRQRDAGKIAYLQEGDKLLTIRGAGGSPGMIRPAPGAPPPRPASPPDPAFVTRLQDAFFEAEGN